MNLKKLSLSILAGILVITSLFWYFRPQEVKAAVVYRSAAGTAAGTTVNAIGNDPASAQPGDILIAFLYIESDNAVTAPAGWSNSIQGTTMLDENNTASSAYRSYVYWIRRGAATPDLTWRFASAFNALYIVDYSGAANISDPFSFGAVAVRDTTAAKTYPNVSGTTLVNNETLIWQGNGFDVGGTVTYPTGFSSPVDGTGFGTAISDKTQATAGATGTINGASYSAGTNNTTGSFLMGLKPLANHVVLQNAAITIKNTSITIK